MEGVDATTVQLRSPQSAFSDEEREDSELDEGIHIPSKFSNKKTYEVTLAVFLFFFLFFFFLNWPLNVPLLISRIYLLVLYCVAG